MGGICWLAVVRSLLVWAGEMKYEVICVTTNFEVGSAERQLICPPTLSKSTNIYVDGEGALGGGKVLWRR